MRKFFREYFNYSVKELNPLYFLIFLLLLSIIIRTTMSSQEPNEFIANSELQKNNQDFIANLKIQEKPARREAEIKDIPKVELFFFDPNTIEESRLIMLGLESRIVNNLLKYRESGGRFLKPDDMKMIYGLSDNLYKKIEPWIEINPVDSNNDPVAQKRDSLTEKIQPEELELNAILYKDLIQLTGGDSKMTSRILNYRKLLGGFYSIKQLWEVYEMNDSLYKAINLLVKIDTSIIEGLSLNSAGYSDFLRHPYLNKAHVNLILKYREYKNSNFDVNQFIHDEILADSIVCKIRPYLKN